MAHFKVLACFKFGRAGAKNERRQAFRSNLRKEAAEDFHFSR